MNKLVAYSSVSTWVCRARVVSMNVQASRCDLSMLNPVITGVFMLSACCRIGPHASNLEFGGV